MTMTDSFSCSVSLFLCALELGFTFGAVFFFLRCTLFFAQDLHCRRSLWLLCLQCFKQAPLFCCFPRRCHLCRWCRPLDRRLQPGPGSQSSCTRNDSSNTHQSYTHSTHSQSNCCGATGYTAPFLSTCRGRNTRRITLTFHFLPTHDRTVTKAVGRMQQTNRQSSEPTENTVSVDTASHLYAAHAMDG